jgi:hypothetical protein
MLRFRGNSLWYPIFASAASAPGSVVEPCRPMLPVIELLLLFIILSDSFLFPATCRKVKFFFLSQRMRDVRCADCHVKYCCDKRARCTNRDTRKRRTKEGVKGNKASHRRIHTKQEKPEYQVACRKPPLAKPQLRGHSGGWSLDPRVWS